MPAGIYLFFLFLLQNIDCGYSLEPPVTVLQQFFFCIMHGRVFVMKMYTYFQVYIFLKMTSISDQILDPSFDSMYLQFENLI